MFYVKQLGGNDMWMWILIAIAWGILAGLAVFALLVPPVKLSNPKPAFPPGYPTTGQPGLIVTRPED